jgi:hypothetical protein
LRELNQKEVGFLNRQKIYLEETKGIKTLGKLNVRCDAQYH